MALRKYRYQHEGQEFGPLDESLMRTLVASGDIGPDDLICSNEDEEWVPAGEVFVFPKKRERGAYQVPPLLAHPPEPRAFPWSAVVIALGVVLLIAVLWAIFFQPAEEPTSVPAAVPATPKRAPTQAEQAVAALEKTIVPKNYDELIKALESPPAPPADFENSAILLQWWKAYSQLFDRYWGALTEIQQSRIPPEVLAKWRAPWRVTKLAVKEAQGEVREVRPTTKLPDLPPGYVAELLDGPILNCVLYSDVEEVAKIAKGSRLKVSNLKVIRISDEDAPRFVTEGRIVRIWYARETPAAPKEPAPAKEIGRDGGPAVGL